MAADNLAQHLAALYADYPLVLFGDDDNNVPSTISQPSLMLRMIDLLQLKPGHRVFELGAGSGWNAALIGHRVGPAGSVVSLEIIPEVAAIAAQTIAALGIKNVNIVAADGGEGYAAGAPFDRAIFTAGAYDLPRHFYGQVKDGGILLCVIKIEGGGDSLFVLRKTANHFESIESMPCAFVQLRGKSQMEGLEPMTVETLPDWATLQEREISRAPFWWGGKGRESFAWRTLGIRFFLGISDPCFRAFKSGKVEDRSPEDLYFGLWDQEHKSLVLAKDDSLIAYGNAFARERLAQKVQQWVALGMPSAASFKLRVYPADYPVIAGPNQWDVKRRESRFLWSLDAGHS